MITEQELALTMRSLGENITHVEIAALMKKAGKIKTATIVNMILGQVEDKQRLFHPLTKIKFSIINICKLDWLFINLLGVLLYTHRHLYLVYKTYK